MRKIRGKTMIKLPAMQPDCCVECPLLGLIPRTDTSRPKGSKETHVCLGTFEALTQRGTKIRASQRDSHHPLNRPCDLLYDKWLQLPERTFSIPDKAYIMYRFPYEQTLQLKIKYHNK